MSKALRLPGTQVLSARNKEPNPSLGKLLGTWDSHKRRTRKQLYHGKEDRAESSAHTFVLRELAALAGTASEAPGTALKDKGLCSLCPSRRPASKNGPGRTAGAREVRPAHQLCGGKQGRGQDGARGKEAQHRGGDLGDLPQQTNTSSGGTGQACSQFYRVTHSPHGP